MADDRLISADKFKRFLCECCNVLNGGEPCEPAECNVMLVIDQQPTIDAVEVVHGRWKSYHEADIGYDEYGVRCSNCGFEVEDHEVKFIMHYCPNCGAKMDGG